MPCRLGGSPQVLPDVGPCKDEVFVDVAFEGMLGYLATGDASC